MSFFPYQRGDGWAYLIIAAIPILIGALFVFWGPLYGLLGLGVVGAQIKYMNRHKKHNIRPERPLNDEDGDPDPSYFR